MESYQGLLTDLSDVCRRCYWVLLGVTVGSYQRLLTNLSDGLYGVLPDLTDRPHRGLYGFLPGSIDRLHRGLYGL